MDRRRVSSCADELVTLSTDCWFRETYKGSVPNSWSKKSKGTSKEQCERSRGSNGVDDDSTSGNLSQSNLENLPRRHLGPSAPMDENEDEDFETGYTKAAIWHGEPFRQSKGWYVVHALMGNFADEQVCSPRDFSVDLHQVLASGHKNGTLWCAFCADETTKRTPDLDHVPGV